MANEADLKLIEIPDFDKTNTLAGAGSEWIPVAKADGKTYAISTADFKEFLGITGPSSMGGVVPNTSFVPEIGSPESPSIWFATGGTPEAPVILPGFGGISLTNPLNVISWNGSTAVVKGVPIEVPEPDLSGLAKKEDVSSAYTGLNQLFSGVELPLFEKGNISGATGEVVNDPTSLRTRIRTSEYVRASKLSLITSNEQVASIALYNEQKVLVKFLSASSSHLNIEVPFYYKIIVRNKDLSDISLHDNTAFIFEDRLFLKESDIENLVGRNEMPDYLSSARPGLKVIPYNDFEGGTLDTAQGLPVPVSGSTRIRSVDFIAAEHIHSIEIRGEQEARIFSYSENKTLIDYTPYFKYAENISVGGFFKVIVRNVGDTRIESEDVDLTLVLGKEIYARSNDSDGGKNTGIGKHIPPTFSSVPFGYALNLPLQGKVDLFESVLEEYPASVEKKNIGKTHNGVYDMFVYTVTPDCYTVTIAVTAHIHANERYNPLGFLSLLAEISKMGVTHPFLKWIRENVRWEIVFISSPTGYVANSRNTDGVNLNRNFDYRWTVSTDSGKGPSVMSQSETQNIVNYFTPLLDEIDFHLDLHDIPGINGVAYAPFQNRDWLWLKEQTEVVQYLSDLNAAKPVWTDYVGELGSTTNFFNENLGIPSITPEHVTSWWTKFNISLDSQIAKAAEQLAAFICMFANLHESYNGNPFYKKFLARSFCSEDYGILTWSNSRVYNALSTIPQWSENVEEAGVNSFILTPAIPSRTILVLGGISNDDKNSTLTLKNVMEEISKPEDKTGMYVNHLKKCRIIVVPILNPSFSEESVLQSRVQALLNKYSPDYTLLVRGVANSTPVETIKARTKEVGYFTDWTKENIPDTGVARVGIEEFVSARYSVIVLNNHISGSFRYSHGTMKWIEAVMNDMASFFKDSSTGG